MEKNYRKLSESEILALEAAGCTSTSWDSVNVSEGFDTAGCRNVSFSGEIRLGKMNSVHSDESGVPFPAGLYNARVHNCTFGDNVLVYNIRDFIANYSVGDEVVIRDCGKIHTEGISSFGNGTGVAVMNETGGRTVSIWDGLSAHQAYIVALYRHRADAIKRIEEMTETYVASVRSGRGTIEARSKIIDCRSIRNVRIGRHTTIDGASRLNEGSINSCEADPVYIGTGVIMDHFIASSGSRITDSTVIENCFIGQGTHLGKHYSAVNSLFFANCGGFHGEACSVFAGPYTETHHKSTLLIAGIFSFMNAGSGSNQSNHMYKLGPIHQGIVERGSKTTSDSYLLWPAHIGPFTLVMGRHYKNLDTTLLPFSYLIESNDESILVPAINLRSVGTIRDAQKWPRRDRRKDTARKDFINFKLLSPYTVMKMIEGRNLLMQLQANSGQNSDNYYYKSMKITRDSLVRGIKLYQMGIDKFLGNSLIKRLEGLEPRSTSDLSRRLKPAVDRVSDEWIDLAGLIAPKGEVERLLVSIESGKITDISGLASAFRAMYESYKEWEWTWTAERLAEEHGKPVTGFNPADVTAVVSRWMKSVIDLDNMLYDDARKEFTLSAMTGFGMDGGDYEKKRDFEQVRGDFESNTVVKAIKDHIVQKTALGNDLIARMNRCPVE
ncbi:MAG: DUF4954 family protein [Bacteroidales bacterium]